VAVLQLREVARTLNLADENRGVVVVDRHRGLAGLLHHGLNRSATAVLILPGGKGEPSAIGAQDDALELLLAEGGQAAADGVRRGWRGSTFAIGARALGRRLEPQDVKDLIRIASILEKMLADVRQAFSTRDLDRAISVLRADSEIDRLRNLMFVRHVENPEGQPTRESIRVLFMAQSLERAGDHAKNCAEEVCHFVSGHTLRHVLRANGKSNEQMFLDWLKVNRVKTR